MTQIYSPLVHRAVEYAAQKHLGQWRKNPDVPTPYFSHPANVAILLSRSGFGDQIIAAGVLHDVVEDCGVTLDELAKLFGDKVAELVSGVSEDKGIKDWEERKRKYREVLENEDVGAVAVAAADHLHNTRSLIMGLVYDPAVAKAFHVDLAQKLAHEKACLDICQRRLPCLLTQAFAAAVQDMEAHVNQL